MITEVQRKHSADYHALDKAMKRYIQKLEKTSTLDFTSDAATFTDIFEDKMLLISIIRVGLPYELFDNIKNITPFTEEDWADYLNLSKKTLSRHRNDLNYVFKPIHTEKIIELAEVTNFGTEVFDTTEQFYLWLNTPSYALGNIKPAELLKDSYGKELVMAELTRIDQGIFA